MRKILIIIILLINLKIYAQNNFPIAGDATLNGNLLMGNAKNIIGGFGAITTGGVQDWNHISNSKSGNGYTLLDPTALNSPFPGYYHSFNFEYSSKDGTGNITQFAIPYYSSTANTGYYYRTRYGGSYTSWMRILTENISGNVGLGNTSPQAKLHVTQNSSNYGIMVSGGINPLIVVRDSLNNITKLQQTNGGVGLVGTQTNNDFGIYTNNLNRVSITKIGNVGIGTTAPSSKFEVLGNPSGGTNFRATGNNARLVVDFNSLGQIFYDGSLHIFRNFAGTERLRIDGTSGNIGIGNINPLNTLSFGTGTSGIGFYSANSTINQGKIAEILPNEGGTGFGDLIFRTYQGGSGGGERMRILNNGNIGIATQNATEKLDVNGSIKYRGQGDYITSASGFSSFGELFSSSDTYIGSLVKSVPNSGGLVKTNNGLGSMITMQLTDGIRFHTNLSGNSGTAIPRSSGEVMRITHSGNVGIGTNNPLTKLDINGRGRFMATDNVALQLENSLSPVTHILYRNNSGTNDWYAGNESGLFTFYNPTVGYAMRIATSGNVGIGAPNPLVKLQIGNGATNEKILIKGQIADAEFGNNGVGVKIGTVNNAPVYFTTNDAERLRISPTGQILIGTSVPYLDYKLAVAGNIIADKIKVKRNLNGTWPDFVFETQYKLPDLFEIESYVKENKHLPEIPSAAEVEKDGQDLGEMNRLLLKKVEELTLYVIEMKKENQALKQRVEKLEK